MKYDKRIKIRFWGWHGMQCPFDDALNAALKWRMWDDIEDLLIDWLGKLRYLIQFPWVVFLVVVLFPLFCFGILRNNARILWRYFKHAAYKWRWGNKTGKPQRRIRNCPRKRV